MVQPAFRAGKDRQRNDEIDVTIRRATLIAVALVVLRSFVWVWWEQAHFDSDQAIHGLMALHIADGEAWPVFMYGQSYLLAIEAWLATHPDDAARVAAWRAQADAIRARYDARPSEPVPKRFDIDALARSGRPWRAAAAAATVAFLVGAIAGWVARSASAVGPSAFDTLNAEALSAHKLYIAEVRHPIEVRAAEQHLMPWLSRRVGTALRAPDLDGFSLKLLGGRLLPGPIGPAALFMYESPDGERPVRLRKRNHRFVCSDVQILRAAIPGTVERE